MCVSEWTGADRIVILVFCLLGINQTEECLDDPLSGVIEIL